MRSEPYPDDGVTQVVLNGTPVDAFEEEDEGPDTSAGYGSLLSLGASMRKKQPLLMVDPVEAENEARRVQFVAAQQLVDVSEPEESDAESRTDPGGPDMAMNDVEPEPFEAEAEPRIDVASEEYLLGAEVAGQEDAVEYAAYVDTMLPDEAPIALADEIVEAPADVMPAPVAEAPATADDEAIFPLETPEPWPVGPVPHGHSLRSRIPAQAPRRTFAGHTAALLAWFREWLRSARR